MLGDDILDLRDVERELNDEEGDEDARLIAAEVESETGYTLHEVAHNYDPTLIHESYFEDYAREFAESIGAIDRDGPWPTYHIDWPRAADDLKDDFTAYDFNGHTYYGRTF